MLYLAKFCSEYHTGDQALNIGQFKKSVIEGEEAGGEGKEVGLGRRRAGRRGRSGREGLLFSHQEGPQLQVSWESWDHSCSRLPGPASGNYASSFQVHEPPSPRPQEVPAHRVRACGQLCHPRCELAFGGPRAGDTFRWEGSRLFTLGESQHLFHDNVLTDGRSSVALGRVSGIWREGHLGTLDCGTERASLLLCEPSLAPWFLHSIWTP